MLIVFLKCIKILQRILLWDLHGLGEEALALLLTSRLILPVCSIYMLPPKRRALCASAIALIFLCWCLKMFPVFFPAQTRNGMLSLPTEQSYYMLSARRLFRASR